MVQAGTHSIRQLPLLTKDLVVDPTTQTIYASVPSSAGSNGNSITTIDPAAGSVGASVFVGSEPGKLAISDNGQYIYVALDGANAIRRYNTATQTPELQFSLGTDRTGGPLGVEDIAVMPGSPETIAVSRIRKFVSPRHGGVAIYENGVQRPVTTPEHTGSNVIEFSGSPSILYGNSNEGGGGFYRMGVATCGVAALDVTAGLAGVDLKIDNGLIYTGNRVFDPEAKTIVGTFAEGYSQGLPETKANRVYFVTGGDYSPVRLLAFDMRTFLLVGALELSGVTGRTTSLLRWGTNGLAFRTTNDQVFLLQNSLIGVPSGTVTPAPTPAALTYGINGQVKDFSGNPISGVTIKLSGAQSVTVVTDVNGKYSLDNLVPCGNYTLTPSHTDYAFRQSSLTITNLIGTLTIPFLGISTSLSFSQANYTFSEGAGRATVTVSRTGNISGPASVRYTTVPDTTLAECRAVNGKASERCDYSTTVGTLRFAGNQTTKTFVIPISDDAFVEGNETVNLVLSNPVGTTLGPASTATLTIADNDAAGAQNPFLRNDFFVRQQYLDFLNREPDQGGFADWQNVLNNCGTNLGGLGSPTACDRVHVSSGFYRSTEFTDRGYFIYRFYEAALGRLPGYAEFVPDMAAISGFQTFTENEASKAEFITSFMARQEFVDKYAGLTSAAQAAAFIQKLEQVAGVQLPEPQRTELIAAMQAGRRTAGETLRVFVETKTVFDRFFFRGFVAMQYFGYLRRDPDAAGYTDWVDVMTNGRGAVPPQDYRHMIFGFMYSTEYRERFGQP